MAFFLKVLGHDGKWEVLTIKYGLSWKWNSASSKKFAQDPKFGRRGQFGMEFDGTIVSGDFSSSQTIAGWWFGTVINNGY